MPFNIHGTAVPDGHPSLDDGSAFASIVELKRYYQLWKAVDHIRPREQRKAPQMATAPKKGEIRDAMAELRAARAQMVGDIKEKIGDVIHRIGRARSDGLVALDLVVAEVEAHEAEVQEINDEFGELTNGPPPGPLPGSGQS